MDSLAAGLVGKLNLSGNISQDVSAFLAAHGCVHTIGHSARVAAAARSLATRFHLDPNAAFQAGWLHDSSAVIPNIERIAYAEAWQINVLPEERLVPMIVHQKLSAHIAQHIFQVRDQAVLSAIGCHTTLKPGASPLDKLVFIADKICWDRNGEPPYKTELEIQLVHSLQAATVWYISYIWQRRTDLQVIHPWLVAAYAELAANVTT